MQHAGCSAAKVNRSHSQHNLYTAAATVTQVHQAPVCAHAGNSMITSDPAHRHSCCSTNHLGLPNCIHDVLWLAIALGAPAIQTTSAVSCNTLYGCMMYGRVMQQATLICCLLLLMQDAACSKLACLPAGSGACPVLTSRYCNCMFVEILQHDVLDPIHNMPASPEQHDVGLRPVDGVVLPTA